VRDELTEFEGVIMVRSQHITGCDRYCVRPTELDDGDYPDSTWFDEQRLESTEETLGEKLLSKNQLFKKICESLEPEESRMAEENPRNIEKTQLVSAPEEDPDGIDLD